ncbi:MAG: hypothetical protein WBD09_02210 [Halobacteriota archaeon]
MSAFIIVVTAIGATGLYMVHYSGYNTGYEQGRIDGYGQGHSEGYMQGYEQGYKEGNELGVQYGYEQGYMQAGNDMDKKLRDIMDKTGFGWLWELFI